MLMPFRFSIYLPYHYFQQMGAEIGRGGFAIVYSAFNVETGDFVAVKRFPLDAIDDDSLNKIQVESRLLRQSLSN